jgi:DNA polymerase-3 subunit gamma/tau
LHEVLSQVAQPVFPTKTDSITAAELPSQSAMVKEEKVIVEKTQAPISGNTVTSKFSIQDFIKNKEVENTPIPELAQEVQLPNHHFTEMDLQAEWSYFLQQIQQKDIVTYNAINGFKILLS